MRAVSFAKDSREEIREARETSLDEIRKEQANQTREKVSKDLGEYLKGRNMSIVMGVLGTSVALATAYLSGALPVAVAAGSGLFGTLLAVGGFGAATVLYKSPEAKTSELIKKTERDIQKTKEIEDKNRSENREATRSEIRELKKKLETLGNKTTPQTTDNELWQRESTRRRIDEKANSLIESSPARKELANRLRAARLARIARKAGGKD